MTETQGTLFRGTDHAADLDAFVREHPEAWAMFCRFALEAIDAQRRAGRRLKIGAKAVAERVRWETTLAARDAHGWRWNNSYTAPAARRFMAEHPGYGRVFETRGGDS